MPAPAGAGCNVWWWLQLVNPWNNGNKFSPKIVKFMLRFLDCAIDSWLQRAVLEVPCLRASVQWELVIKRLKMALVVAGHSCSKQRLSSSSTKYLSNTKPTWYHLIARWAQLAAMIRRVVPFFTRGCTQTGATCHYHREYRDRLFSRIRSSPILALILNTIA